MRGRQQGQTGTEYMLLISVIVIAVTAAAYFYVPTFQNGVTELAKDTSSILATGQIGGIGMARGGSAASPGGSTFKTNPQGPGTGNIPMDMPPGGSYSGPLGPASSPPSPGTVSFNVGSTRGPGTGVSPMSMAPKTGASPASSQ